MHAIIETGGKQYRVAPGDVHPRRKVGPAMSAPKWNSPPRPRFRMTARWSPATYGEGHHLWRTDRAAKIIVFKFKRKKQYKKTIGHRQSFTEVKVGDILVVGDVWHIKKD